MGKTTAAELVRHFEATKLLNQGILYSVMIDEQLN